ncbi:MAG: slipin family protein [Oscillospiraceae bacterium]
MKTIINENQRGFLFRNGKFIKVLPAGKHYVFGDSQIEIHFLSDMIISENAELDVLLTDPAIKNNSAEVEVKDCQLALHFVNGIFKNVLTKGRYAFWTVHDKHEFMLADISSPDVSEDIPEYIFSKLPLSLYTRVNVAEHQRARLYFNGRFERLLTAGTYCFWNTDTKVTVEYSDARLTKADITGQEILTQDKVTVRVNFVCSYRITDFVKISSEIDDYKEQIHTAAQLALRDFIGRKKMDDILESKEEMSEYVMSRLKAREKDFYVEFADGGVKDIILPGEIREIMNTVIAAEKRAQANVITRREEVASTRSLLNTAKLMDENKTLYRLKELEYIERIFGNAGSINVNGGSDLLAQLTAIVGSNTANS